MLLYLITTLSVILLKLSNVQAQYCVTPLSEYGVCVILTQCPYVVQLYGVNNGNAQALQYLLGAQRSCGTRSVNGNPVVCCSKPVIYGQTVQTTETTPEPQTPIQTPPTTLEPEPVVTETTSTKRPSRPSRPRPGTSTTNRYTQPIQSVQPGEKCNDPNGVQGVCRGVRKCRHILHEYKLKKGEQSYIKYLQKSNEICSFEPTHVCCPSSRSH